MFGDETYQKIKVSGLLDSSNFITFMDYIEIFDDRLKDIGLKETRVILRLGEIHILFLSFLFYDIKSYKVKREYDIIVSDLLEMLHDLGYNFNYSIKDGGRITFNVDILPF